MEDKKEKKVQFEVLTEKRVVAIVKEALEANDQKVEKIVKRISPP